MTGWWEQPYNGGPMVAVPGFPRQLRVGDKDGPDVVAYKRTVSRAGRWPWQPFDDSFSKAFSTGSGPNVIDTGVAGVQRQQNMPDDGIVDEKTFNTLRSIRVPEGKPHAGEMAMDANAANLLAEAYTMFNPSPPPKKTTRERALDGARKYIGYTEAPPGTNQTTFGKWYSVDGQPWCAIFCTYCYEVEAGGSPSFVKGSQWAYVPYIVDDARHGRNGLATTGSPVPGDLVCFDWEGDQTWDHVGLFSRWTSGRAFETIEGNTSPDDSGSQSNGGGVYKRQRDAVSTAVVFVRVAEP